MGYSSDPLQSRRYRAKHELTRLVLLWEAFWSAAAPAVGALVGAVAIGLLEILQNLGSWLGDQLGAGLHTGLLVLFLGGFLWLCCRAISRFRVPSDANIKRRIEASSGLTHRPLTALSDSLANSSDQRMSRLWEAFRRRAVQAQSRLHVGPPRPVLPSLDPFAIRAAVGLLLVIAVTVGWQDPGTRLWAALKPNFEAGAGAQVASVDVWISPPAYTGQPPVLLTRPTGPGLVNAAGEASDKGSDMKAASVPVPIGSKVLAAVNGGTGTPQLVIETTTAEPEAQAFEQTGAHSHRFEMTLDAAVGLSVRQGGTILYAWDLDAIPDLPPKVKFTDPPSRTLRDSLIVHYKANDDYGIAAASVVLQRLAAPDIPAEGEHTIIRLPLPGLSREEVSGRNFINLTSHAWAGLNVQLVLRATDEIGQVGESESLNIILPERIFSHPVARAIIKQRKRLAAAPQHRRDIAKVIMTIAVHPHRYNHDFAAFLALKFAASRLGLNGDGSADDSVGKILWETALRIEDGQLSMAAERLRELERQLQDALASEASDEKIDQLIDKMKEAIDEYLQAMVKQARGQQGQAREGLEREEIPDTMPRQDLQEMLDQMRDMAKTGAQSLAKEMLSRIQESIENMSMGQQRASPQQRAMQEMMRQLSDLSHQQQQLMDDTYKQHQDGEQSDERGRMGGQRMQQPPRFGKETPRERNQESQHTGPRGPERDGQGMIQEQLARAQEQLRHQLGEFMRKLSESINKIPDEFGRAERSMKDAVGTLNKSEPGDVLSSQANALGQMQEGAKALNELMREHAANGQGTPNEQARGMQDERQDEISPLNRRRSGQGFFDRSRLDIADESDVQKARRLFDELRRRSGDRERPVLELDYIDRLLKRF
jgi:uncharacterized protein (TIGR02302 family)